MDQCPWSATIDDYEGKESAEDALVKCVTLFLCELGEAHDVGRLRGKAAVEHCFYLALAEVDTDCRGTHVLISLTLVENSWSWLPSRA